MDAMSVTDARHALADVLNGVAFGHNRVMLTRRGKAVAAIISCDDLALLEALEDARDVADYDRAITEDDGQRVTLDDLRAELGV